MLAKEYKYKQKLKETLLNILIQKERSSNGLTDAQNEAIRLVVKHFTKVSHSSVNPVGRETDEREQILMQMEDLYTKEKKILDILQKLTNYFLLIALAFSFAPSFSSHHMPDIFLTLLFLVSVVPSIIGLFKKESLDYKIKKLLQKFLDTDQHDSTSGHNNCSNLSLLSTN